MNDTAHRRIPPDQSSGSLHTFGTPRHPNVINPILSKRVCFYKSGDPQFSGLRMVVNNRTFKTFDALLDSLSKKVPLPFGVRNITTPRGVHAINTLDELEDGKSYICSDSRKVKPVNLALARKKLPPWYHARPISAHRHRRTAPLARAFPGWTMRRQEPVLVHTPKRLLVFRNGDPSVKHLVVLRKRSTATFEWILEYISEMLQFHVVKLHTPDGRRVEGLPGLILCSGMVVAAGKEPFRPANYYSQKSPASTRPSARRLKALSRKKKSLSYKSRNFSTSSERYIVNKIHNSLMESSCEIPSNPTNSIEYESGHVLESVAETDADVEAPAEDDIEKSFRVNQDGSMTVEMKVRLTIKEEETLHWTTTLTRSGVANQLNMTCLPELESQQDIMDLHNAGSSSDTISKDKTDDDQDEDAPLLGNGVFSQSSYEDDDIKIQPSYGSPRTVQTPGHKQRRKKQDSVESVGSETAESHEGVIGSYTFVEDDGAMMEHYCMVKQSSTRPIPKPRRLSSMDANGLNNVNMSSYKSSEILQIESSGEEVTETVLHIYEQQTCQDNFHANVCTNGMSFSRPATSETGHHSTNNFEPEFWRPSTASGSVNIWKAGNQTVTTLKHRIKVRQQVPKSHKGKEIQHQLKSNKTRRSPQVKNKGFRRLLSAGKRQNSSGSAVKHKKAKPFSSAGFLRRIYGNKLQSQKNKSKLKRRLTQSEEGTLKAPDNRTKQANYIPESKGVLIQQTSVPGGKREDKRHEVSEQMSLPAFDSSSSVANAYVESWLKKAHTSQDREVAYMKANSGPLLPEDVQVTSVRYRIQSLENKLAASNVNIQNHAAETKSEPKMNRPEMPAYGHTMVNGGIQEPSETFSMEFPLPPPPEEEHLAESKAEYHLLNVDEAVACNPPYVQPPGRTSDNHLPSVDPTPAQDLPHSQHVMKMTKLLQHDVPNTLERAPSIKRAPLVSNVSLERHMSVRKACLDKLCTSDISSLEASETFSKQSVIAKSSSTVSPNSLTSEERLSSVSIPSGEVQTSPNNLPREQSTTEPPKIMDSPPPDRKLQSFHQHSMDRKISPKMGVPKQVSPNTSPSPQNRQTLAKSKLTKKSTCSQSMDLASPSARRKSKRKILSRNFSSDSPTEAVRTNTPIDQDNTCSTSPDAKQMDSNKETDEKVIMDMEFQAQSLNIINRSHRKDLLDKVCYSIKSIRQITQNKRSSCLEKSNSLPDFSSHVASTFGSSSKVLLAFLSIMTLKDSISHLSVDQLGVDNISCAEALKMIDSLREIASMEDSQQLKDSLSELQKSATKQLLESWRGFQEMGDKYKSSTPSGSERDLGRETEEQAIDDFIDGLDIPEILKEELTSLSASSRSDSDRNENMIHENSEAEGCRTEEYTEENCEFDHEQQKINLDHDISDTAAERCSEEEADHEDETLDETPVISLHESPIHLNEPVSPEVERTGMKVIVEESQSGPEEEQESLEEEEHMEEETQEDISMAKILSGDSLPDRGQQLDPDIMSLIDRADDMTKQSSLGEDDSGNDHSSCRVGAESVIEHEQMRSSMEEELSFYEKECGSGEEHNEIKCDKVNIPLDQVEEITSQPVAARVSILEKQVAERQKSTSYHKHTKKASLVPDVEELSTETSKHCSRSAPQSSLSFSYDSSGVGTTEHEGNRVKSIRDMFLAKGSADVPKQKQALNTTQPSEFRAESGGYQTQTSGELSSGEEDSSRKSISKGFVRRTIERLYGKKDAVERPPSAPTTKKHSSILSPLRTARSKAASELSYFNSTTALDTLTEATRCIAFNAQVGPGDSVPIDAGRWLIRENTLIRKSVSDPTGINKNLVDCHEDEDGCEDTQENTPYSLFSTTSQLEDSKRSKRCTYFSLPHTSDSEVCLDDPSKNEASGDPEAKDSSESAKAPSERNGSAFGDFKMMDNKVHPLVNLPADGDVVVLQPGKGHGVVNRHLQEPDVLDIMYNFCGQHCPIL
uniref:oxygen-regulated protein 1-like isoform X1 n=2 Tax=Doryrhamphus excisus TaxID=161450 RepID=UPI0025AEA67B|nr:oxygen-regulated protein 1-like isoform X1 [Doryrhamphus excisus]